MKDTVLSNREWKGLLTDQLFLNKANHQFESIDLVRETSEFKNFINLLDQKGKTIYKLDNQSIKLLLPSDFESIDQRVGLAFFANVCFDKSMGLDGTSIADNPKGQLKFLEADRQLVSFIGEKIIDDDFNRRIYYLDIAGTLKTSNGKGFGPSLGRKSLEVEIEKSKTDIVFLSRTQNPMLVSMARKILPDGVALAPFWGDPSPEVVESSNWMVEKGYMSRNNNRPDTHFSAAESMISWNSYGRKGDGSTWEDMTKQIKNLDWNREEGILMQKYLSDHDSSLAEAKVKGHSFVIGAFIKNLV